MRWLHALFRTLVHRRVQLCAAVCGEVGKRVGTVHLHPHSGTFELVEVAQRSLALRWAATFVIKRFGTTMSAGYQLAQPIMLHLQPAPSWLEVLHDLSRASQKLVNRF